MTQDEKQLLLKDLCARLPYELKVQYKEKTYDLLGLDKGRIFVNIARIGEWLPTIYTFDIKPYLRPISSMTEEEKRYIHNKFGATNYGSIETYSFESFEGGHSEVYMVDMIGFIDWLNKHHFDYRGLINKGLALEAPEDMYKKN